MCLCTEAAVPKTAQDKTQPSCHHIKGHHGGMKHLSDVLSVCYRLNLVYCEHHRCVVCVLSFIAEKRIIRLELTRECISALRASSRKSLCHGCDIYFLHGSYLNVPSHNASDCSTMLAALLVTNMLTQSQKCSLQGLDV